MGKNILVIYYSQSGQLQDITDQLTKPLIEAGHVVEKVRVDVAAPYPFPWTGKEFFAVMPDCVREVPTELKPFALKESRYDLIILGYQAWFLSPSIPVNSILLHPAMRAVLKDTPVVAITGARNMWIGAMERIKLILRSAGARLAGHIALIDKHHNFVSFVTIFYWMFKGKKGRWLNLFPMPGVAEEDIQGTATYGTTICRHLESGNWDGMQDELIRQKAVDIRYNHMFIETKAKRIFGIWAGIISKKKKKTAWLVAFKYYLLIALFIAAPIILTVDAIFFKPFLSDRIRKQKLKYSGIT